MTFPYGQGGGFIADSYDADAVTYFNAMSVAPDATRKGLLNTFILGLKSNSIWDDIAWISLFAAHDAQAARINIKNPSQVAGTSGSPTFTTDQGYAGDNTSAYLSTTVAGTTVTDTDCSMFLFMRTNGSALKGLMGYRTTAHEIQGGSTLGLRGYCKSNGLSNGATSGNNQYFIIRRTGTTQTARTETTTNDTDTIATNTLSETNTFRFLANSTTYTDAQLSMGGWGNHLDDTQSDALRTLVRSYLTSVGAI